jgi:hypothetical protein
MKNVQKQAIADFSDRYLDVLEKLYGNFDLHPAPSIEGLCYYWNDQFVTHESEKHSADIVDWHEPYIGALESLYGPINLHPDPSIEEVNLEWMNLFMTGYYSPKTNQKVA